MSPAGERAASVRLDATAHDHARIHQAGRDLHVHYGDGVRRTEPAPADCPYPGLAPFGQDDARWFFGRDRLTADLLTHLDERGRTGGVQVVLAPSGAGKSSLLRAGLAAALARGALPGSAGWRQQVITPTAAPLAVLADAITALDGDPGTGAVLVVDQFEELFTLCDDDTRRHTFVDVITRLAQDRTCLVVIGVRADFYADCVNHPGLRAALQDRPVVVGPMTEDELREVIVHPARDAGLDLEPALVELLLRDLGAGVDGYPAGRLPLLAHALRVAWQQRHGATLTVDGYRTTGGISGAVAKTADRVCAELGGTGGDSDDAGDAAVRSLFLRLVRLGDGAEDTRRCVARAELTASSDDPARTAAIIDAFTSARLLTQDHDTHDRDTVEITHEALLRGWPRLRRWIDADRAGRLLRQRVEESALAWDRAGRDPALLYRGSRLDDARSLATDSPVVRAFVRAADRQRRRAARRRTGTVAVLAMLTVVASVAALVAVQQQREARDQRDLAVANRVEAEAARLRGTDASLAARLDLVRHRLRPDEQSATQLVQDANSPLYSALPEGSAAAFDADGGLMATGPDERLRLWDTGDPADPVPLGESTAGAAHTLALSPDGDTVATAGYADVGTEARLWDVSDPARPVPAGGPFGWYLDDVLGLRFSPDGAVLAAVGRDGIALWDVTDRDRPVARGRVDAAGESIHGAAFSPDGRLLAVVEDESVRLWEVSGAPVPAGPPVTAHDGFAATVAFGPDGIMATGGLDGAVRLWDVTDRARPAPLADLVDAHAGAVNAVTFSRDGTTLASASFDGTVRLWDLADPRAPLAQGHPLRGHTKSVLSVAFHPAGSALVSVGEDDTVRLWTLPTRATGATDTVWDLAFSPDGRTMAAAAGDHAEPGAATVAVWDVADPDRPAPLGHLPGPTGLGGSLAFRRDGHVLGTAGEDGLRLWDLTDPTAPAPLGRVALRRTGDVLSTPALAFHPDGDTAAVIDTVGVVVLVDVSDPAAPVLAGRLPGDVVVNAVAFDPVRGRLATAEGELVRLWDVADPAVPVPLGEPLEGQDGWAGLEFGPDGNTLVSLDGEDTIRFRDVSDVDSPGPVRELAGHTDSVYAVAFGPDGRTLASASADDTVGLWDLTTGTRLGQPLTNHTDVVRAVAFGPGGVLATAGSDRTIRLWRTDAAAAPALICASTRGTVTATQWRRYVGDDVPVDPPCD